MSIKTTLTITVCILLSVCKTSASPIWDLVWADEFNYKGLPDSLKWKYDTKYNSTGWGNNEKQHYTAFDSDNAWVENGILKITARKEKTEDKDYSSARLISKADWKYGKIEVRAKVPTGLGTWPAIWMLPRDAKYGIWPRCGEIDIMENVGYDPHVVHSTVHTFSYNHTKNTQKGKQHIDSTLASEFHTYSIIWDENEIRSYIDGKEYFIFKNENKGVDTWPFDQPFHILLNLAIGGNWGGKKGIDDTLFPHTFEIDYVRVYKKLEPIEIKLWENEEMPYSDISSTGEESIGNGGRTSNISSPSIYIYPAKEPNGIAVLACPGGGYAYVSMDGEGHSMAPWMNERGITLAVLKYRLPNGHKELPLIDAERAMLILKENAKLYGIDTSYIGVMGSSAGGHLASTLASRPSKEISRPAFQILQYPVISMEENITHGGSRDNLLGKKHSRKDVQAYSNYNNVNEKTPKAFIVLSSDDRSVPAENSIKYYQQLIKYKINATMHIYDRGGHGWGFGDRFRYKNIWKEELSNWFIQAFPEKYKN